MCWDCASPDNIRYVNNDEATLFSDFETAKKFCTSNNINNFTLENL